KTSWLASASSISTLCSPGGMLAMSTVLRSLASAHNQGRSSTWMCRWPTRGDTSRASFPNTGTMRTFSVRYWIQTTPLSSRSGSGASTISLGGGSFLISAYGVGPRTSLALRSGAAPSSARPDGGAVEATTPATAAPATDADLGTVNFTVLACPGKTWWLASASSISTSCSPGGMPAMSTVLRSLASAHSQGRSSTRTCRWPTRGDTSRASFPKTGTMRTFSVRYWIQTTPLSSRSGSGASTISLGGGSFLIAAYGVGPRTSLALRGGAACGAAPSSA